MADVLAIGTGTEITLHFTLALDDGQIVDSNMEGDPATFVFGDGNLLPGFEETLIGMFAGQEAIFEVPPEKGFGQPNPNNIQTLAKNEFDNTPDLEVGLVIGFSDAGGGELPGVVKSFDEDEVEIDFNHPLAGQTIQFSVKIVDVKPSIQH